MMNQSIDAENFCSEGKHAMVQGISVPTYGSLVGLVSFWPSILTMVPRSSVLGLYRLLQSEGMRGSESACHFEYAKLRPEEATRIPRRGGICMAPVQIAEFGE